MDAGVCDGHWERALLQVRQPIRVSVWVHSVTFLFLSVQFNLKIAQKNRSNVQFCPRGGLVRQGWLIGRALTVFPTVL